MHLVIDDKIPYIREAAARLGEATYLPGAAITAADVCNADALIIRTRTRCDEALLGGLVIRVDGRVIDGSLKHRLHEIKEVMNR